MEKCSEKNGHFNIYNSMTTGLTPFTDNDCVIYWTMMNYRKATICTSQLLFPMSIIKFATSEIDVVFACPNYLKSDLFRTIPSCSSCPLPTDGTLCYTWALTHTTDLCSHQDPQVSFQTLTDRYFIPSLCGWALGTLLCTDAPHHLPEMLWPQFIIDCIGSI